MGHSMERWYNAVGQRFSVRKYAGRPGEEELQAVERAMENLSAKGVRFELGTSQDVFKSMFMGYGKIRGTDCYAAIISDHAQKQSVGYLGEAFILECTALGIGTCWVGGTYKRGVAKKLAALEKEEQLVCIIPLGIPDESYVGRPRKDLDVLTGLNQEALMALPDWQQRALECARKAPSAVNMQPWRFSVEENTITVRLKSNLTGFGRIDCGIAMLHIELGASHCGVTGEWSEAGDHWTFIPYGSEANN